MTTFTLTVDDHVAALIRQVAARERKDPSRAATELLAWAANRCGLADDAPSEEGDEAIFQKEQDVQIQQIFERNTW